MALFEELLQNRLTAVGTVMANRLQLPFRIFPCGEKRHLGSSMFAYEEKGTMVSWYPKKSKFVLFLSTLHHDSSLEPGGKPEIISYYNQAKARVDALCQKVCYYSAYGIINR